MLAENNGSMVSFLKNYLHDIQNTGPNKIPWRFEGSYRIYGRQSYKIFAEAYLCCSFSSDPDEFGYNIFDEIPFEENLKQVAKKVTSTNITTTPVTHRPKSSEKCDSNSNIMPPAISDAMTAKPNSISTVKAVYKKLSTCTVVLNSIDTLTRRDLSKATVSSPASTPPPMKAVEIKSIGDNLTDASDDDDGELFEIEESEAPHVPLYHLRDEGAVKWALVTDLCYLLKLKSKDSLLKQVSFEFGFFSYLYFYFLSVKYVSISFSSAFLDLPTHESSV